MEKIHFIIERDADGGFCARATGEPIFTQADTLEELNFNIQEAICCHYDEFKPYKVLKTI